MRANGPEVPKVISEAAPWRRGAARPARQVTFAPGRTAYLSLPFWAMARSAESPRGRERPRWSARVARVAGIDVRVHVTFLLLVVLIAVASQSPGGPGAIAGVAWLVVVFTCVVVHEFAHSIVARARGAGVREILLLPIGGVSRLENLPERPVDELAIAVAGPAASVGLAAVAALVAYAARVPLWPITLWSGPWVARIAWLNAILAAFNLLPAFPLDGGRVLRSLLERRMDLETATHRAATVGRALAVALVVAGFLVDVWLVFIGMFVFFGASAEEAATIVHARIGRMRVRDVMLRAPLALDGRETVAAVEAVIEPSAQRAFPVLVDGEYVGMATAEVLRGPATTRVGDRADRNAPGVGPGAALESEGLPALRASVTRAVPVLEEGRIVGLLREEDVIDAMRRGAAAA